MWHQIASRTQAGSVSRIGPMRLRRPMSPTARRPQADWGRRVRATGTKGRLARIGNLVAARPAGPGASCSPCSPV